LRQSLSVSHSSLPGFNDPIPGNEALRLSAKMQEWNESNFAGYRRILRRGSDCFPDIGLIRKTANAHRQGATGRPIRDFVVLGIGGSSLGGEALIRALRPGLEEPRFHFMDNSDPQWFRWFLQHAKAEETLFYVVAKSGGTPETMSQFLVAIEWMKKSLGDSDSWKKHFVLCTDPEKGDLREVARRLKLSCLDVPPSVGGRFSALSPVGLFPAAFAGLALEDLLSGAESVAHWEARNWSENPCAQLARALALNEKKYPITVLMPYSTQLSAFSRWFCQLWGESLGKGGHGLTPYPAVGATDQHSQMQLYMEGPRDKTIVFVHVKRYFDPMPIPSNPELADLGAFSALAGKSMGALLDAEFRATRDAVTAQGIPNCTIELDTLDANSLGALIYFCEWATAIAGAVLDINPFDQPGVEAAKVLTKKYLAESK
jgi:glucose-6-phosphate isomerase